MPDPPIQPDSSLSVPAPANDEADLQTSGSDGFDFREAPVQNAAVPASADDLNDVEPQTLDSGSIDSRVMPAQDIYIDSREVPVIVSDDYNINLCYVQDDGTLVYEVQSKVSNCCWWYF